MEDFEIYSLPICGFKEPVGTALERMRSCGAAAVVVGDAHRFKALSVEMLQGAAGDMVLGELPGLPIQEAEGTTNLGWGFEGQTGPIATIFDRYGYGTDALVLGMSALPQGLPGVTIVSRIGSEVMRAVRPVYVCTKG